MNAKNRYFDIPSDLYNQLLQGDRTGLAKKALLESNVPNSKPCIFLSHKSDNKSAVKEIANYILDFGIDVYFDIFDKDLQYAVKTNNDAAITNMIELGISQSTHLLVILSDTTDKSWWVPYEIGFSKGTGKDISSCIFKEILGSPMLPSYLEITRKIQSTLELDKYLQQVKTGSAVVAMATSILEMIEAPSSHKLSGILK